MDNKKKKLGVAQIISFGYLVTIAFGTILLLLPFSTKDDTPTSFINALFISTSATCVTGLTPYNTGLHFSLFGQIVILLLIQIGGLGFMTVITLLFMLFRKNVGLYQQTILMQSAGTYSIGGVMPLIKKIIIGSFGFEFIGAIILFLFFRKDYSIGKAIYYAIFHSISAFCNAGFDCLGSLTGSLTIYSSNAGIIITISILIVLGGLGFICWSDIIDSKFRFKKLQLHTKVVLFATLILIFVPMILFLIFEFTRLGNNGFYTDLSFKDKLINSLFLSISPRTAGFNSIDLDKLTPAGKLLTIVLMFIGGNSGSTAGGLKVTTMIVILANLFTQARGKKKVNMFKQEVGDGIIKQASALANAYLILAAIATILISSVESFTLEEILFEVISATSTVGLSLGITASLSVFSKVIIIILMFAGRIGAFALFDLLIKDKGSDIVSMPEGRILVG